MSTLFKNIETAEDRRTSIISSDKNWLEDAAITQLKKTMELPGMRIGIGMPDLHPGKGQPIGAAFVTENCIYPHMVGSDIGCGMGLWQLDIPTRKVKLDKWEKQLVGLDELWNGNREEWLGDRSLIIEGDFSLTEHHKLGTIGGDNHFAELQQIHEIIDSDVFDGLGIDKKHVFLLVHSGSRGLGQKILRDHVDNLGSKSLETIQDEYQYEQYQKRHNYAIRWAEANRELIAERFCQQLKTKQRYLFDVTHNMVEALSSVETELMGLSAKSAAKSDIDSERRYWIHRKGASPTNKGLVMIPGSRGSLSYLVKPRVNELSALALGGFSLAHGAGRKWKRSDARGRLEKRFKVKDLEKTSLGSRVICKQRDLLYEEAPQAYKNISQVVSDLAEAGMVDIVATFKPLLTYKTRRT
ncbi:RNA ligase RtcB family protein [Candidatus Endobugula sertula]|uniref:tRNA-splicing ligase RtcB n=1 Tax=Candidatus Endobugula sertula TaxID=62101 RepID=A0A1D2QR80_9GAMM|nr:RNA ligase RtcB family protein [Candidatus Endobugula sertula]